jgi:hypothetical protein
MWNSVIIIYINLNTESDTSQKEKKNYKQTPKNRLSFRDKLPYNMVWKLLSYIRLLWRKN